MKGATKYNILYKCSYNEFTLIDSIMGTDNYRLLKSYGWRNKNWGLKYLYNARKSSKISNWKYWYKNYNKSIHSHIH